MTSKRRKITSIVDLPFDNLHHIFVKLPIRTQAMCRMACTTFNDAMCHAWYAKALVNAMMANSWEGRGIDDGDAEEVYSPVELLGLACHGAHSMRGWNNVLKKWCYLPNLAFLPRHFVINAFTHCFSSHGGLMYVGYLDRLNGGGKGFVCNPLTRWYVEVTINDIREGQCSNQRQRQSDKAVLRAWENGCGFTLYIYKACWRNGVGMLALESDKLGEGAVELPKVESLVLRESRCVGDPVMLEGIIYCLRERVLLVQPFGRMLCYLVSFDTSSASKEWREHRSMHILAAAPYASVHLLVVAGGLWIVEQHDDSVECGCRACTNGGRWIKISRYELGTGIPKLVRVTRPAGVRGRCRGRGVVRVNNHWPTRMIWVGRVAFPCLSTGKTTICFARCALNEPAVGNATPNSLVIYDVLTDSWSEEQFLEADVDMDAAGVSLSFLSGNFHLTGASY